MSSLDSLRNPVLLKELRMRLRSRQPAPVRWSIAIVVGTVVILSYYQAISSMVREGTVDTAKNAWNISLLLQSTLVWLLCPALASNAITQEKEQQTWEMLVFSLLSPSEILTGKLIVRLAPIVALLLAFLPFNLFCVIMGGVSVGSLLLSYLVTAIWVFFMTTVSLFMSWAFRKTAAAIAMSYLVLFTLVIGTLLLEYTFDSGSGSMDSPIIWLNPFRIGLALVETTDFKSGRVILLSSVTFLSIGVFLFWRMVTQFRAFSVD